MMKTNIFFFLARFGLGGAGNSVFRLASSLNRKKFNISVISLGKCAYKKKFNKLGIKVFNLKAGRLMFSFFELKKIVDVWSKNKKKNIFVSNINYTNIFCSILFWRNKKIKLIGVERTPLKELEIYFNNFDFIKKLILKILLNLSYSRFDKIVCNSKYIAQYLKENYGYKSITIHPPSVINRKTKNLKLKNNQKNFKKERIDITTVCRLSREKNIESILFALNKLNNKNCFLNIVGDGPEKTKLLILTKKLGLNKRVIFHGYKKKISEILKKTDLYINSSLFEGFPNSVVEAAYLEIPIIASQSYGGINEILSGGRFGTIYSNNYLNLATKIENFIKYPKPFLIKAKLAKTNSLKFNLKNNIINFENLFMKI